MHPMSKSMKEAKSGTLQKRQGLRESPPTNHPPPRASLEAAKRGVRDTFSGADAPGLTPGSASHWLCDLEQVA